MSPHASFTAKDVQSGLHRVTMGLRHHAASIQRIKVDFSKVPDWTRRATRLSMAIMFFGILGHCVQVPPEYQTIASNFRQSCNWAAITCIVVTAPLIGKVAQVAFDRLLGTAVGGFIGCVCFTLGFHLFGVLGGGIFISLMSGVTVWITTYLAFKHSMDQLVRFVQLTYIIVAFGAKPDKGALLLALLRVGGIFAGGLLSVILAVVVLPRSASIDCLLEMKKALKVLYDLNQEVWALSGVTGKSVARRFAHKIHRHGYSALQLRLNEAAGAGTGAAAASKTYIAATLAGVAQPSGLHRNGAASSDDSLPSWPDSLRWGLKDSDSSNQLELLVKHDEEWESHEAAIEKLFTAVYTALGRVDEHLAQTRGEIYIWHFWGRYFFLPGVHWFPVTGRWRVPKKDLEDMATCLRRVARMLWTLLLDFEEGFGSEMEAVLHRYYPKQLLSELADYQARAILDLLHAFPGGRTIEVDNLFTLGQVTDCLMQISDARARNTVFDMKRRRAAAAVPSGFGSMRNGMTGLETAASTMRRSGDRQRLLELSSSRSQHLVSNTATPPASTELEKQPLLAAMVPLSSGPVTAPAAAAVKADVSSSGQPIQIQSISASAALGLSGNPRPSALGSSAADLATMHSGSGSTGNGVFISRLMSGTPGEPIALHLPPRRYLQEQEQQRQQQQQQQQEGQPEQQSPPKVPENLMTEEDQPQPLPAAVGPQRQDPMDIFGGFQFDALLGPITDNNGTAKAMTGSDGVLAAQESQLAPATRDPPASSLPSGLCHSSHGVKATATTASAVLPSPDPLPPQQEPQQQAAQAAAGRRGAVTPFDVSANAPSWMEPLPSGLKAPVASGVAGSLHYGLRNTEASAVTQIWNRVSASMVEMLQSMPSSLSSKPAGMSPPQNCVATPTATAAAAEAVPSSAAAVVHGLSTMLSVEPVTFPPTEEGYLSQVRWYSFQFVMDEMVNELEEAFHACSSVLQKLPYPIGN